MATTKTIEGVELIGHCDKLDRPTLGAGIRGKRILVSSTLSSRSAHHVQFFVEMCHAVSRQQNRTMVVVLYVANWPCAAKSVDFLASIFRCHGSS